MNHRIVFALLALSFPAAAASGLRTPAVGVMLDHTGAVRPILGLAANFLAGEPVCVEAVTVASSATSTVVKTGGELLFLDHQRIIVSRTSAPPGGALVAFTSDGEPGAVYYESSRRLYQLRHGRWWRMSSLPEGKILDLRFEASGQLRFATWKDGEVWLARLPVGRFARGEEIPAPGVSAPLLLLPGGALLYGSGKKLVLRSANGEEHRFPLPGEIENLFRLGPGWVQVRLNGPDQAFRVATERLYYLPGGMPQ